MSGSMRRLPGVLTICAVFLLFASPTARTASDVDPVSLKAARVLIGATVKTAEFEAMLRQVVQNFSNEIARRTEGANEKVVVRALMEQAGYTISLNRGLYLEGIARIYAKHLSARELRAAAAFYSSPEGQQYVRVQQAVTTDTVKYAVAMGGSLKPQIIAATIKSLKGRGYKTKKE